MLLIAVVGLARSGKDTVAGILAEKYGFEHLDFYRDVIVPLMKEQGLKPTKANAASFGDQMRARFGMGVFGEKMAQKLKGKERVVVTGARSLDELKSLEKIAQTFYIVRVEAPEEQRFSRRSEREPVEREVFFSRDSGDLRKKGLGEVLRAADFFVENTGSIAELEKKLESLMERIK